MKRALIKDGWTILSEQVSLKMGKRQFWIDLRAIKNNTELVILIEVKAIIYLQCSRLVVTVMNIVLTPA